MRAARVVLGLPPLVLLFALARCSRYALPDAAGADAGESDAGEQPVADAGKDADVPACVHERIDLSTVTLTAENTFTGDGTGEGQLQVTDAGLVAEAQSADKNFIGLVLTARGFVRRLDFAASRASIRFSSTTTAVSREAVVGCWIIHVDSRVGINLSQSGFAFGTYVQDTAGAQILRARAPLLDLGENRVLGAQRPLGSPPQVVQLESTRAGDAVTFHGQVEDGVADASVGFTSPGLSSLLTEIVCGVSLHDERQSATAAIQWVEIDACP